MRYGTAHDQPDECLVNGNVASAIFNSLAHPLTTKRLGGVLRIGL